MLVSVDFTSFARMEIEDVVCGSNWNELFCAVPTHQSFDMHPQFMANFAVHWNHETVGAQIGI